MDCIVKGDLVGLKRVLAKTGIVNGEKLFLAAVSAGNMSIIRYLHALGCKSNASKCIFKAMKKGHITVLNYLNTIYPESAWEIWLVEYACSRGNVELLRFIKCYMCINKSMINTIMKKGDPECVQYLIDAGHYFTFSDFANICKSGKLESLILAYKYTTSFPNDDDIYEYVYDIDIVKYLREVMKVEVTEASVEHHVREGNLEIVKYFCDGGWVINNALTFLSLQSESLEIVKYFHQKEAPFPDHVDFTCYCDIKNINIAKYCHDNIYSHLECGEKCIVCITKSKEELWNTWYLVNDDYQSYNQWLPLEILEDVTSMQVRHVHGCSECA